MHALACMYQAFEGFLFINELTIAKSIYSKADCMINRVISCLSIIQALYGI